MRNVYVRVWRLRTGKGTKGLALAGLTSIDKRGALHGLVRVIPFSSKKDHETTHVQMMWYPGRRYN
jgi:hypothetical protein